MSCEVYLPLIEGMTWSYSRVKTFADCPYQWYLHYIRGEPEEPMFYASYGSFIHELIASFYRGEIRQSDLKQTFLLGFSNRVEGVRPSDKIVSDYIAQGADYFENFTPLPYRIIGVEQEVNFEFSGLPFIGFIDLLAETSEGIVIIDHKSRTLKPRSTRKKPTLKDAELDEMLYQLYLYAEAVNQIYGKYPVKLCFNCFRNGVFIEEPFRMEGLEQTKSWVTANVARIKKVTEFFPQYDFFPCRYLCGHHNGCCYYEMMKKG